MRESATGVSLAELGVLACGLACGIAVDAARTIYARAMMGNWQIATELLGEIERQEVQRVADRLEASETASAAQDRIRQLEQAAADLRRQIRTVDLGPPVEQAAADLRRQIRPVDLGPPAIRPLPTCDVAIGTAVEEGDVVIGLRQRIVSLENMVAKLDEELEATIRKEIASGSGEAGRRLRSLEERARGVMEGWSVFSGKLHNAYRDVEDKVAFTIDVARMDAAIVALGLAVSSRITPVDDLQARGAQIGG